MFSQSVWLGMNIIIGFIVYYALPKRRANTNINIPLRSRNSDVPYAHFRRTLLHTGSRDSIFLSPKNDHKIDGF